MWLGDIPLAVIDQNTDGTLSAVYYIETDFTNTPRYLRNATGDLVKPVWSWPVAPYGDIQAQEDPDGDGNKVSFNLRFPGQYYDSFSGLHYNYTRYFQPRTGRYLQPDLIWLEGGTNVYTYAGGNPVGYTDPTGTLGEDSLSESIGGFLDSTLASFESGFLADTIRDQHFDDVTPGQLYGYALTAVTLPLGGPELKLGGEVVEGVVAKGVGEAYNVANATKLEEQLTLQSAKSPFTKAGTLTQDAISASKEIFAPGKLGNSAIPNGFGKYMTDSFRSPSGDFTVHFYKNPTTEEVFYGLDYKVIFNSMSGVVK